MKKLLVAAVATVMFLGVQTYGEVKSVNVVGVMGVEIASGGDAAPAYTFMSIPLTKLPVARGRISANTANTITDSDAAWADNMFAVGGNAVDEPGNSSYYVEIASGGHGVEGLHFGITGNSATTLTLNSSIGDPVPDLSNLAYKIIPANRIRDIFGEPGSSILKSGTSAVNADIIQLWTGSTWGGAIYHRSTGPTSGLWLQAGSVTTVEDLVIDRDEGVLVRRSAGEAPVTFSIAGEVSGNAQTIVFDPGYNLVGGMFAIDQVLDDTGLGSVLTPGTSANNADTLQAWGGSTWAGAVYRRSGTELWLQAGNVSPVGDTFVIGADTAYLFKVDGPKVWYRPSPLTQD